jgi:hypothetical protein
MWRRRAAYGVDLASEVPSDVRNVVLDDRGQGGAVGNAANPARELRVPD